MLWEGRPNSGDGGHEVGVSRSEMVVETVCEIRGDKFIEGFVGDEEGFLPDMILDRVSVELLEDKGNYGL